MEFLRPSYLKKGDTILLIGISRARSEEQLEPAIRILETWGLKVEKGPNLYKKHHQFAGTDHERGADLQWAIEHPKAKAVLFAGGGYGAMRVIDRAVFDDLVKNLKWFAGYSDATAVFSRLSKLGISCIHSTMAFQFEQDVEATESLRKLLFGEEMTYRIGAHLLNRSGKAKAPVVGGNLSLLYALAGSKDDLETEGRILFIEDLDEQLYHIDRMMLQLKRSGKLEKLAGLVVGGMSDMKDNAVPFGMSAEEIIMEAVKDYSFPVCFGFPAGHIKNNMAIYFGKTAELKVSKTDSILKY